MTATSRQHLIEALRREAWMPIADDTINLLLSLAHPVDYRKNDCVIRPGELNADLYIVDTGILRLAHNDGEGNEITYGFGSTGTLFISPSAYILGRGAYFYLIACTDCRVLRVRRDDMDRLLQESPEVCRWMLQQAIAQFAGAEMRSESLSSQVKNRFDEMLRNKYSHLTQYRPDIVNNVTDKVLASYLGVTPTYLSRLKSQLLREQRSH